VRGRTKVNYVKLGTFPEGMCPHNTRKQMNKSTITTCVIILLITFLASCSKGCHGCHRDTSPETTIVASSVMLEARDIPDEEPAKPTGPKIRRITIGPRTRRIEAVADVPVTSQEKLAEMSKLPPDTFEETDLSSRLREKMLDAYQGREEDIPDVKIYISDMRYDEFVSYYQNLGYKVSTVAVPASQIIEPVLDQRPEMKSKINMADYDNVVIHQVMVDEAGISASDKYIDPDTFEVIDKTFVTKMNKSSR